jgi:hypothetical protein
MSEVSSRVVMFSGGIGSWAAAKRVAERYGTERLTLLFTDTRMEDEDLYRFLDEAAANVGGKLVKLTDGRSVWELFFAERMMGNSRADLCSRILKRELADNWVAEHCEPADTVIYVGIDWSEKHRIDRLAELKKPWRYEAPLTEPPYLTKSDLLLALQAEGIKPPRLYSMGFAHNNCGGFCVKAGFGHFANLLRSMPERYAYHEAKEQEFRQMLGRSDISILKRQPNRIKGKRAGYVPVTLKQLREEIEAGGQVDLFDIGGCGCFVEGEST